MSKREALEALAVWINESMFDRVVSRALVVLTLPLPRDQKYPWCAGRSARE